LYRNPDILIFDEATSALDSETEEAVMEAVRSLAHHKTIVVVTHRMSSLRDCEQLFVLENGKAVQRKRDQESMGELSLPSTKEMGY
jgi:ABC-type multidrug transport system fused ATPase/permease subunit